MEQVLAQSGVAGYNQYRIPGLGVTASGRILAVYDARPDVDDLPAPIDLVYRISDNCGQTWSEQRVLRTGSGFEGFGDASVIGDAGDGRIMVFHAATTTRGFFDDVPGADHDDPLHAHIDVAESVDDGLTWTYRRLTEQLKASDVGGAFAASGTGGKLAAGPFTGRLLQTIVDRIDKQIRARIAFSDDLGASWQLGAPFIGGNESAAIGLADGRVLFTSRATPRRVIGISTDGAATINCAPHQQLPDPSDNGSLLALSDGSVVVSFNHDQMLRRNLVLKRSLDGGVSWPQAIVVEPDSAAYSTMAELPDGRIAVLYEGCGYQQIVFETFAVSDFRPSAEVVAEPTGLDLAMVLRLVRPAPLAAGEDDAILDISDTEGWDANAWRETGAAVTGESLQRLHTREYYRAQTAPSPGLHQGDTLVLSASVRHMQANISELTWVFGEQTDYLADIAQGQGRKFELLHEVTERDITAGYIDLHLAVSAHTELGVEQAQCSLTLDTTTGLPQGNVEHVVS